MEGNQRIVLTNADRVYEKSVLTNDNIEDYEEQAKAGTVNFDDVKRPNPLNLSDNGPGSLYKRFIIAGGSTFTSSVREDIDLCKDPDVIRSIIKGKSVEGNLSCALNIQHAGDTLKADTNRFKPIALEAVAINGMALKDIGDLNKDEEVVKAAVNNKGFALEYASDTLKDNPAIVTAAVNNYGTALQYAKGNLNDNYEIVLAAVKNDGRALQYASDTLKDNPAIVTAAVKNNGEALQYASAALKGDYNVVKAALKNNETVLRYASPGLQDDPTLKALAERNTLVSRLKKVAVYLAATLGVIYIALLSAAVFTGTSLAEVTSFITGTVGPALGGFFTGIGPFFTGTVGPALGGFFTGIGSFFTGTLGPALGGFFVGVASTIGTGIGAAITFMGGPISAGIIAAVVVAAGVRRIVQRRQNQANIKAQGLIRKLLRSDPKDNFLKNLTELKNSGVKLNSTQTRSLASALLGVAKGTEGVNDDGEVSKYLIEKAINFSGSISVSEALSYVRLALMAEGVSSGLDQAPAADAAEGVATPVLATGDDATPVDIEFLKKSVKNNLTEVVRKLDLLGNSEEYQDKRGILEVQKAQLEECLTTLDSPPTDDESYLQVISEINTELEGEIQPVALIDFGFNAGEIQSSKTLLQEMAKKTLAEAREVLGQSKGTEIAGYTESESLADEDVKDLLKKNSKLNDAITESKDGRAAYDSWDTLCDSNDKLKAYGNKIKSDKRILQGTGAVLGLGVIGFGGAAVFASSATTLAALGTSFGAGVVAGPALVAAAVSSFIPPVGIIIIASFAAAFLLYTAARFCYSQYNAAKEKRQAIFEKQITKPTDDNLKDMKAALDKNKKFNVGSKIMGWKTELSNKDKENLVNNLLSLYSLSDDINQHLRTKLTERGFMGADEKAIFSEQELNGILDNIQFKVASDSSVVSPTDDAVVSIGVNPVSATSSNSLNMSADDAMHDLTNIGTEERGSNALSEDPDNRFKLPDVHRDDDTAASSSSGGSSKEDDIGERRGPDGVPH